MGRGTKRKRILALLGLAILALLWAWLPEHPAAERTLERLIPGVREQWISLPGPASALGALGDAVIGAGPGTLWAADLEGNLLWRRDTDFTEPVILTRGKRAAVYDPGGGVLIVADRHGSSLIQIPTGILACAIGPEGQTAVVTAGSGFLTETRIFDPSRRQIKALGLRDSAMAMMAWLEDGTLAACCVTGSGRWRLRLGDRVLPLEARLVYDMKPLTDGVALWTSDGLAFYRAGALCWEIPLDMAADWDCGDFAALSVWRDGGWRLLTITPDGGQRLSQALDRKPEMLRVCNDWVGILDRQSLLVYDDQGTLRENDARGGRADWLWAGGGGILLAGDGCLLRHILS